MALDGGDPNLQPRDVFGHFVLPVSNTARILLQRA
jgi:hypothetical protein